MEPKIYTLYEYNKLSYDFLNNLSIIILNILSFNKNIDNFLTFLDLFTYEPDILILTETWLTKYDDPIIYLKNYNIYQTNRSFKNKKRGGCVAIFVKKMYKSSIIDNLSISIIDSIDIVSIQIIDEKSKNTIFYLLFTARLIVILLYSMI